MLTRFLEAVPVLPIDETACDIFGRERGRLRREGRTIGDFDLLIAATCLRHGLTLCSNNRRLAHRSDKRHLRRGAEIRSPLGTPAQHPGRSAS